MTDLIDYVKYFSGILDKEWCDFAMERFAKSDGFVSLNGWESHGIDRNNDLKDLYEPVINALLESKDKYLEVVDIHQKTEKEGINYFIEYGDKVRIQRIREGGFMAEHVDNNISRHPPRENRPGLFYGSESAISKLSAVLHLNDDYEGGEFYIIDKEYKAEKGSVILFPSNFMYPHGVKKVTKGVRWSVSIFLR